MIRDRGIIKWNSLMLPEHVKMLKTWTKEDQFESRHQLDEQQLELFNSIAQEVIVTGKAVRITYFKNHRYEDIEGKMEMYPNLGGDLQITGMEGETIRIPIKDIREMRIIDE